MKLLLIAALAITPLVAKDHESAKRLDDAAVVLSEVMAVRTRVFRKTCWSTLTVL